MACRQIDLSKINNQTFKRRYVGCVILTQDNRIVLQQRGNDWHNYPGYLSEFGGRIEHGEQPMQALIRELNEELGANVNENDVLEFGHFYMIKLRSIKLTLSNYL